VRRLAGEANRAAGPATSEPAAAGATHEASTRRIKRRAAAISLALGLTVAALVGALIYLGVLGQNRLSVETSERRVVAALERTRDQLGRQAVDNGWWSDALENLVERFDPDWAAENVGRWMHETYGVSATVVLGARDEPIYAVLDGAPIEIDPSRLGEGFAVLARTTRAASMAQSVAATGLIRWRGAVYAAGVAAMTPEYPTADQLIARPRPILAFLQRIDDAYLNALAQDIQVSGIVLKAEIDPDCNAWLPLSAPDGARIGGLGWNAPEPGTELLRQVIAPVLAAMALLGVLAALLVRRTIRTAEELERALSEIKGKEREARAAAREAQMASAAKSRFLANISHELRSPLHAIIGFASFLREEKLGPVGQPKYRDFVEQIHEEGKALNQIVDDLLDYTRLDSGVGEHEDEAVDLAYVLQTIVRGFQVRAEDKGVALTARTPSDAPRLLGDERGLRQLVRHMIDNAVKFTAANGAVRAALESVTDADGATRLRLIVADDGVGMDQAHIDQMMAPFEQGDADIDRRHGGVGIGLALVRLLLRNHQADLEIESAAMAGARFIITFPAARTLPAAPRAIDAPRESA